MANKNLSATITIGGLIGSSLKTAFGETGRYIDRVNEKVRQLNNRQKELNRIIRENEKDEKRRSGVTDRLAREELADLDKQIARLKQIQNLEKKRLAYVGKAVEARSRMMGATVGFTGAALPVIGTIRQAIEFESAMSGVSKQMDGARDANGKLTPAFYAMRKEIQKAAREIPLTTVGITWMVEASLRMGVAREEVIGFTRSTAMMATAFEMAESEIADSMGKISNLYRIPITAINDLGDTINWLDNNTVSKSSQIIDFLLRAGGTASGAKITDKQMAALGSTMISLGTNTESAATSVRAMFTNLGAAAKMPKTFQNGLKALGLSARNVQTGMQTDAMGTIRKLFESIKKLPSVERKGVLYQLFGKEHIGNIEKLVNGTDQLDKQLALATGRERVGSMMAEYENRLSTTEAQLQLTKNRLMEVSVNIGSALLPALNGLLETINPVITGIAGFAQENPKLTKTIIGVVGAALALNVATKAAKWGFFGIVGTVLKYRDVLLKVPAALGHIGSALKMLRMIFMSNPLGLVIGGLALGAALIIANWDKLGPFFEKLWQGIKVTFTYVYDFIVGRVQAILDWLQKAGEMMGSLFGGEGAGIDPQMYVQRQFPPVTPAGDRTSQVIHDNSRQTIQIYQQPGQDPRELADEIERRQKQRAGIAARSAFADGAGL